MDDGEVIQDLEEPWSFLGATLMEWMAGLIVFLVISLFGSSAVRMMPFMLIGLVATPMGLASIRHMHPDGERGLRNVLTTSCGLPPPGIPAPASLQPEWSGAPVRELDQKLKFVKLGLDQVYPSGVRDLLEEEKTEL